MGGRRDGAPRVLVADDDPSILVVLEELLADLSYEVRTARNGQEALEMMTGDPPDLVILDVAMPSLSGTEVVELLRSQSAARHIPVILMSAAIAPDHQDGVIFVPKPFDLDTLTRTVERALAGDYREPQKT